MKQAILMVLLVFLAGACRKEIAPERDDPPFAGFHVPENFPEAVYDFSSNPVTRDGFELGRKLFYEPRLSRNNTVACGSCHIQSSAFTHYGHDVSHGIDDRLGIRNSMPVMNLAWNREFFWDGGVFNLDLFPIVPIEAHNEMDEEVSNVLEKLRKHPEYPGLFARAFGSEEITSARFFKALSQFMLMAVSADAKYDRVMRGEGAVFTEEEREGYALFQQKCATCHAEPLFTDYSYRDNGIGPNPAGDLGRFQITLNPRDRYRFRVPTLRNLGYTAPFMHDGRFLTLQGVLDHYAGEVQDTENLDSLFRQQDGSLGIPLSEREKDLIITFLGTLNDEHFISNPLLAEQ